MYCKMFVSSRRGLHAFHDFSSLPLRLRHHFLGHGMWMSVKAGMANSWGHDITNWCWQTAGIRKGRSLKFFSTKAEGKLKVVQKHAKSMWKMFLVTHLSVSPFWQQRPLSDLKPQTTSWSLMLYIYMQLIPALKLTISRTINQEDLLLYTCVIDTCYDETNNWPAELKK